MKFIPQLVEKKESKEEVCETFTSEIVESSSACMDDLELVAVITAAIAAQEGKSTDGFVVRSIRRRPSNHWN
jgi:Na+-transporting methylmalonyl-CoA/oxaloacetate decarboxylase gamma subunit